MKNSMKEAKDKKYQLRDWWGWHWNLAAIGLIRITNAFYLLCLKDAYNFGAKT